MTNSHVSHKLTIPCFQIILTSWKCLTHSTDEPAVDSHVDITR